MMESLDLNDLTIDKPERPGWSTTFGKVFSEAASVCLEQQNHTSSVILNVRGDQQCDYKLSWSTVDDTMRRFNADVQRNHEFGAYAVSALSVPKQTNLTVIEISVKGTGFDFWLGAVDDPALLFQRKARLEVSGIGKGSESDIKSRVNKKLKQITPSDGTFPGYVAVVEFSSPHLHLVKKCKM